MKTLCVFILGLAVSGFSVHASEPVHSDDAALCSAGATDAKCEDKASHGDHQAKKGKNKDWTHERLEQVEKVMVQPVPDQTKAIKPAMVKLTSPKFLSSINGTEAKLEWTASESALVYHVQVSKDAGFNNRSMYVANNNNVSGTSFEVKNLEPSTKYFWRVAASNGTMKDGYTKSNFTSSAFTTK